MRIDIKNNRFIKIPNNFFYENAMLYRAIGGKYSFVLYCLIVIRKNINNHTYISIDEINDLIYSDKNKTRGRKKVKESLQLLKANGLIDFLDSDLVRDAIKIEWTNLFPKKSDSGWIKFEYNDFDIFDVVGVDFYCVMWVLRMYTNHQTNTSFLQIKDIAKLVGCRAIQVSRAIDLFEYAGLFEVKRGELSYIDWLGEWKKNNNSYKYIGDTEWILNFDNNYKM